MREGSTHIEFIGEEQYHRIRSGMYWAARREGVRIEIHRAHLRGLIVRLCDWVRAMGKPGVIE